jgi:hypothetical protein
LAKRFLISTASVLVFSVLFVSVVYACSGIALMGAMLQHSSMNEMGEMNGGMVQRGPCSDHKQDVCKSVRQRMLSIQTASTQIEPSLQVSTIPQALFINPAPSDFSPTPSSLRTIFDPLAKLSLSYSYLVLRI